MALLVAQGFLRRLDPVDDHQVFQLDAGCLLWRIGDGSPPLVDPIYSRRATDGGYSNVTREVNAFFQRFYREAAATLAALEAREHTAQVVKPGERERRERRFRWEENNTRKVAELRRRLPYLVCSPTMELGGRYRRPRPGPPAKRAADPCQLRATQRPCGTAGPAGPGFHLLWGPQQS